MKVGDSIEKFDGPGKLTKRLGIDKETQQQYEGEMIYGNRIWIEGDPIRQSDIELKKGNSDNCKGFFKFEGELEKRFGISSEREQLEKLFRDYLEDGEAA